MHARDAAGRRVSLLNDEPASYLVAGHAYSATRSDSSSSPSSPTLLRANSYDSHTTETSNDPISPLTPNMMYEYGRGTMYTGSMVDIAQSPFDDYLADPLQAAAAPSKRPAYVGSSRSTSFEDDLNGAVAQERPGKRYPCRYRDSHGCEKTFTTSGHASRHSKIHTAEKAVQCTFTGCAKKFTRADNMKQHLETHYKDKSRSSGSSSSRSSSSRSAVSSSNSRRVSSSKHSSHKSAARIMADTTPLPSPVIDAAAWDMHNMNLSLLNRPSANSGLDALAMAVACQEGA